jgi:hypothetical protein
MSAYFAHSIQAVSCWSNRGCLSAGDWVSRWNGTRWRYASNLKFNDIACTSARNCIGVGESGISRWNGKQWSYGPQYPYNDDFVGISCPSADACIAVGETLDTDGNPIRPIFAQSHAGP